MREIEYHPIKRSNKRPFYVEITTENDVKNIRVFKSHFLYSEEKWEEMKATNHPLMQNEVHPWNLDVYEELVDLKKYPNIITFWTEPFVKFMIDALNDKYEREYRNE
jgi:hypothetical protein